VQLAIHVSIPVIIAGALMTSAVISANMLSYVMIGKINERVPEKSESPTSGGDSGYESDLSNSTPDMRSLTRLIVVSY